jgi:hypothetical protein
VEPGPNPGPNAEQPWTRRLWRPLILVAGLTAVLVLGRDWPKDQDLRFVLGASAPRVIELTARYAPGKSDDFTREVSFRFDPSAGRAAPRVVTHTARLPDGEYTVEIDLATAIDRTTVKRHVTLEGKAVSIELEQAVPK